jgi:hypothetical protein
LFGDDTLAATRYFKELELRPINPRAYLNEVERLLATPRLEAADRLAVLEYSVKGKVDPVGFLADVRAVAERKIADEAVHKLVTRAADGGVDLAWLRKTKLTDVELGHLALEDNTPWNLFKTVADANKRGEVDTLPDGIRKAVDRSVRGAAAELVAARGIPSEGIVVEGKRPPKGPDYRIKVRDHRAEMEVKGWTDETWEMLAEEYKSGAWRDPNRKQKFQWETLAEQIRDGQSRGKDVYVAISNKAPEAARKALLRFLETEEGVVPRKVVELSDDEIVDAGRVMREHLGVPQPGARP